MFAGFDQEKINDVGTIKPFTHGQLFFDNAEILFRNQFDLIIVISAAAEHGA